MASSRTSNRNFLLKLSLTEVPDSGNTSQWRATNRRGFASDASNSQEKDNGDPSFSSRYRYGRYCFLDDGSDAETTKSTPPSSEAPNLPDATFFDLQAPTPVTNDVKIGDVMKRLFSDEHLHFISADHILFNKSSAFPNQYRPHLVPTLSRYLEMRKAMRAVAYANSVAEMVRWPPHTDSVKFSEGPGVVYRYSL